MTAYADYFQNGPNGTKYYVRDQEARTDLALKAPLANPQFTGYPAAPTQPVSDNSTTLATTAFVHKRGMLHCSGTIQQGTTKTFMLPTNSVSDKTRVVNAVFGSPQNVASNVTWTINSSLYYITFTGTFTGSTTIDFDLIETDTFTVA